MVESQAAAPNAALLEFPKKDKRSMQDKRRMLHAVYSVGDLDKTIKFYTECFGMKLLRKRNVPDETYTNEFLGFGPEESNFVVELTYNYGVDHYDIGTGFGHFAIATPDVYKMVEDIRAKASIITREPGTVKGGSIVIAFVKDPTGYLFEIIQRESTPEPLCQVMLRVGDLERSIKFYEKALWMKLVKKTDRPEQKLCKSFPQNFIVAFSAMNPELLARCGLINNNFSFNNEVLHCYAGVCSRRRDNCS